MKQKFVEKRKIMFPSNLFIELTLSASDVRKVHQWEKAGHNIVPMWYTNSERVLFIDEEAYLKWDKKKHPDHPSKKFLRRRRSHVQRRRCTVPKKLSMKP